MSWIWLTGRMPEHEAQTVHGRWYAEELADTRSDVEGSGSPAETSAAIETTTPSGT
jgi:hypothetical protein